MPRQLSSYEVFDFFSRHAAVKEQAGLFELQVKRYGYSNFTIPGSQSNYAIPRWGIAVEDGSYGWVTIFPDAAGILHYSVDVAPPVDINKPAYASPNGSSFFDDIINAAAKAGAAAQYLPWILGGVVLIWGLVLIKDISRK